LLNTEDVAQKGFRCNDVCLRYRRRHCVDVTETRIY
jgi:hypothetical protein